MYFKRANHFTYHNVQLASIGVANEEPNRQALREMLFTSEGVENHISGVVSALSLPLRCTVRVKTNQDTKLMANPPATSPTM
jgi:hypothetical protein